MDSSLPRLHAAWCGCDKIRKHAPDRAATPTRCAQEERPAEAARLDMSAAVLLALVRNSQIPWSTFSAYAESLTKHWAGCVKYDAHVSWHHGTCNCQQRQPHGHLSGHGLPNHCWRRLLCLRRPWPRLDPYWNLAGNVCVWRPVALLQLCLLLPGLHWVDCDPLRVFGAQHRQLGTCSKSVMQASIKQIANRMCARDARIVPTNFPR